MAARLRSGALQRNIPERKSKFQLGRTQLRRQLSRLPALLLHP